MILTVDAKRRLTLPKEFLAIKTGDYFEASFHAEDQLVVFRKLPSKENWLDVLKECPVSMDNVPSRSYEKPKKLTL